MKSHKIAIFANFLDNIGGAEILTLILARELNADVYTTNINQEKIRRMGFGGVKIFSIGKVPLNPPFKQQLTLARFRRLNLKRIYDQYIITGDWAISGAVNNKPNMEYFHSPINEIWEFKEFVRSILEKWKTPLFDIWVACNRSLYKRYFKHVEKHVCNSENTKKRIIKYLGKEATIIHPPVETGKYHYNKNGDFWLSVNRLMPHKRIDMQLKAFSKLSNERLVIVGSYEKGAKHFEEHRNYLENLKPGNVEIINWVSQEQLIDLYANCKGLITTAQNEDFGMTPLEAMASGKPVVASNEGGYRETVVHGKTGVLIDDICPDALATAISDITDHVADYRENCIERAKAFDTAVFVDHMKKMIFDDINL